MAAARLGLWSSVAIVLVGLAYAAVLAVGVARFGPRAPITDPILAVMEVLTLLSAAPVVTVMAALHARAPEDRKAVALAALAFATLFAGATSAVHFVELTAARQLGGGGLAWPSRAYALELLAWDVFLGLALLLAAASLRATARERGARLALRACGVLCLAGTIGPVVGDMRVQRIGIVGYALVLPIGAALLARLFASDLSSARAARGDAAVDGGRGRPYAETDRRGPPRG